MKHTQKTLIKQLIVSDGTTVFANHEDLYTIVHANDGLDYIVDKINDEFVWVLYESPEIITYNNGPIMELPCIIEEVPNVPFPVKEPKKIKKPKIPKVLQKLNGPQIPFLPSQVPLITEPPTTTVEPPKKKVIKKKAPTTA